MEHVSSRIPGMPQVVSCPGPLAGKKRALGKSFRLSGVGKSVSLDVSRRSLPSWMFRPRPSRVVSPAVLPRAIHLPSGPRNSGPRPMPVRAPSPPTSESPSGAAGVSEVSNVYGALYGWGEAWKEGLGVLLLGPWLNKPRSKELHSFSMEVPWRPLVGAVSFCLRGATTARQHDRRSPG